MKKTFLKVLATCLGLFIAIDGWLYMAFDFECIDILLKLFGFKSGINVIPRWIIVVLAVAAWIFIVEYDKIFDYSFRSKDRRKYK